MPPGRPKGKKRKSSFGIATGDVAGSPELYVIFNINLVKIILLSLESNLPKQICKADSGIKFCKW